MPAAAHKAAISFGLVYIPVALFTATQENRISFNQLHKDSHARIRYKKVREDTGSEVSSDEIVKGYQYAKDQYVVLTDEELEKMKTPKDRAITIQQFVPKGSIDPIFFEKSYYVVPEGSDKAYNLLLTSMQKKEVIAVAQTVLGTKETMLVLSTNSEGIVIETLFYLNEIKAMPKSIMHTEVTEAEVNMAAMLIDAMIGEYRPELYKDQYESRLLEAITNKIEGREFVSAEKPETPNNVINLMDALQRSIDAHKKPDLAGVR